MVPRTFPSSVNSFTKNSQLIALFLDNVTGLRKWVDYIPVNFGKGTTLVENSYDNNGFIAIKELASGAGLVPFKDYIPVFFDSSATDTWQVSNNGFIPYSPSGVLSPPSLDISFTRGTTLDSRITFTRSTTATYTNSSGVLSTAAINAPRFDYNPTTLASNGLLIEEQRTNLFTYSEQFDNAFWTKVRTSITANSTIAPDGTLTADTLVENTAANTTHQMYSLFTVSAVTHTISLYVKAAGRNWVVINSNATGSYLASYFNIATGSLGTIASGYTGVISPAANGFFRIQLTATFTTTLPEIDIQLATGNNSNSYTGDGTSGVYIWGAQLEAGAFATSYIPTTTAAATRAADAASMTGTNFSSWYNATEGTIFSSALSLNGAGTVSQAVYSIYGNTARTLAFRTIGRTPTFQVEDGGSPQASFTGSLWADASVMKIAGAYKVNNFAASFAGNAATTGTSGSLPTVDRMYIGDVNVAGTRSLNGCVQQITYYPRRLSNTELQALTT